MDNRRNNLNSSWLVRVRAAITDPVFGMVEDTQYAPFFGGVDHAAVADIRFNRYM